MKLNKNSIYIGWKDNIQLAIDAYEDMVELNEERKGEIFNLAKSLEAKKYSIERLNKEIETYKNTKKELLEQIKHLSRLNGEYRRERHDMEDKLIEATTPWYVKLKNKLTNLSIRNPFYIKSNTFALEETINHIRQEQRMLYESLDEHIKCP